MKSIRITILFVWLSVFTLNAQINDAITFSINDMEIDTIGDYLKLSMLGCSYTDIIGYPELPRLEVRYVIPTDKIVSDVIVSDSVVQLLQGEIGVISDVFHVNYRPCSDEIDNITSEFYIDNEMEDCADTWLFFQPTIVPENFLCILAFEMNCFWHSIHRNIADASAPLNSHEHPYLHNLEVPYHECSIHWSQFRNTKIDSPYYDYYFQVHYAHVIYCNLHWTGGIYPN